LKVTQGDVGAARNIQATVLYQSHRLQTRNLIFQQAAAVRIQDYDSVCNVTRPADIDAALRKRHGSGRNAFWLSHGAELFPAINIMVKGDLAYVHYFPKEEHPGFASVGKLPGLRPNGDTNFFMSSSDEPVEIRNGAVVHFLDALKVAQEFATSSVVPRCIQWFEL
jgi:hypothetical protein